MNIVVMIKVSESMRKKPQVFRQKRVNRKALLEKNKVSVFIDITRGIRLIRDTKKGLFKTNRLKYQEENRKI